MWNWEDSVTWGRLPPGWYYLSLGHAEWCVACGLVIRDGLVMARSPASLPVELRRDGAGGARLCSKIYAAERLGADRGRFCGA
eukprot:Skav212573  [mRNA]  locus=scaffold125:268004:269004:- [translate_table: standard]